MQVPVDGSDHARCTLRVSIVDMVVLRVRTRRAGAAPQPERLYQAFPTEALSLVATLPRGDFPVSIPYHSNSGCGYIITRKAPTGTGGFVLVYALRPNRRYEAVRAILRGREIGMGELFAHASSWTGAHAGTLHRVPGKYLYLAPTRDQWNIVRRDHGYMAVDPACLAAGLTAEVEAGSRRLNAAGIVARVPLLACGVAGTRFLPYFRKAELSLDAGPGPQRDWISFREHMRIKAGESVPPEGIAEHFPAWMDRLREESGFQSWYFRSGRLFGACTEWWGDRNRRYAEHEGIDFAEGRRPNGLVGPIPEGTPVRAVADGEVGAVLDDFLGRTILVRHPHLVNRQGSVLYTQYSHIVPGGVPGSAVRGGRILGTVGRLTRSKVPAHLHFAAAWVPPSLLAPALTLGHLHPGYVPVTLIDFNPLVEA